MSVKDRFLSSPEIATQFSESSGIQVSKWTVCRRLDEAGLRSRRPAKKPLLTPKMRKARLQWAKDRSYWSKRHWGDVIFSDESKFNLIGPDGGARVRRRTGERYDSSCIQATVKHSPYVMVWGAITKHGVGEIIILNGTVDSQAYRRIIDEGVIPTMEQLSEKRSRIIFQDDSAPCHRSKMITKYKEDLGIKSLPWPGNSPDLNPIETLWAIMGRKIARSKPKTIPELKETILKVWYEEITNEEIDKLYESMPRRVKATITAKGGTIRY